MSGYSSFCQATTPALVFFSLHALDDGGTIFNFFMSFIGSEFFLHSYCQSLGLARFADSAPKWLHKEALRCPRKPALKLDWGVSFWGSPYKGRKYVGVYMSVPLFQKTTTWLWDLLLVEVSRLANPWLKTLSCIDAWPTPTRNNAQKHRSQNLHIYLGESL